MDRVVTKKQTVPTICDIAERAGVHNSTVSIVLNGGRSNTRVSESTRKRILDVAAEMRYSPNTVARGLKSLRHHSLGVSFHYQDPTWITSNHYGNAVLTGIIGGSHECGYNTTIFHKPWRDAANSSAGFRGQGIDGFLVVAPGPGSDMVSGLSALGIPLVVISSRSDEYGVPSVGVDNVKAVRLVMEHLIGLGHRRIAHLTEAMSQFDWIMRRETFLTVAAEAGLNVPSDYARALEHAHENRGYYQYARYLLTLPEPPTAIFAPNDGVAMDAIDAARDLGIDVPGQLSVVGFDDELEARRMTPALTTVRYSIVGMGKAAAKLLIALIEGEPVPPITHLSEPELVVRASTAPPP